MHTKFWWGNLKKIRPSEDVGLDGRILTIIVDRYMICGRDSSGPLEGQMAGSCEYVNGPSGSVTCGGTS